MENTNASKTPAGHDRRTWGLLIILIAIEQRRLTAGLSQSVSVCDVSLENEGSYVYNNFIMMKYLYFKKIDVIVVFQLKTLEKCRHNMPWKRN